MHYTDELGLEIILPQLKKETVVDAIIANRELLIDMLNRHNQELKKNSCKNPIVRGGIDG